MKLWSILKYSISLCLLLLFLSASGQQVAAEQDTSEVEEEVEIPDSLRVRPSYIPTGLRIGTDLIQGIKGYKNVTFDGYEINADIDFYRYYLTVDYGRWAQIATIPNGRYNNDGKYVRFGVDVNMLKRDPDRNMFFMGLRYAHASFSDSVSYFLEDKTYGDRQKYLVNTNLTANWMEVTTGLRVKIWKFFWMGYTIRLKFAPQVRGNGELQSFDIPGYGVAARSAYWGFNYQIFFRIPVRKAPKVLNAKE
jgi:hypothetical protein